MRKGGPSEVREAAFKASAKGKETEECKESGYISKEDVVNFVKKLQLGTGRFRVKLPSNVFLVVELVIVLLNVLIKTTTTKGSILQKLIGDGLIVEEVIILTKIVMACQIVKKVNLFKILNYSWLLRKILMSLMINLWMH